jgi:hypothetical protein
MEDDRYCMLYKSDDTGRYLPVILHGDQGDMAEEYCTFNVSPSHRKIVEFARGAIEGVGAKLLYGELYYSTEHGRICGRIACRQQNSVNKIFSFVDAPPAYVIAIRLPVLTDIETLDHMSFSDVGDVSDAIGYNMNEIGEKK